MPVQNAEIVTMFDQTADLLEIEGENPFRVRAYRNAARVIEGLPQSVLNCWRRGPIWPNSPNAGPFVELRPLPS